MLIATATLISLLFFGNPDEIFLIGTFDKGVKKEIVNKDLQKEIKNALSEYEKRVKVYKKLRKNQKKELGILFGLKSTSEEEFSTLYMEMQKTLNDLHREAIKTRIMLLEKISDDEWENIIKIEKERLIKLENKKAKGKEKDKSHKPFSNFTATIQSLQLDSQIEKEILDQLNALKEKYNNLANTVMDTRNKFSKIILDKKSSKDDLESVADWNNEIKKSAFNDLTDLHLMLSKNVPESSWDKVAKEFKKLIK